MRYLWQGFTYVYLEDVFMEDHQGIALALNICMGYAFVTG